MIQLILVALIISSCGMFEGTPKEEASSGGTATDSMIATKDPASDPTIEIAKTDAPSNISDSEKPIVIDESTPAISPVISEEKLVVAPEVTQSKIKVYEVQKGETLMQIAFKLYGDISKWKELKQMNNTKLTSNGSIKTHTKLSYNAPDKEFVWNPTGSPYLIKNGETLGTISNGIYKTPKNWKKIWENNKPLIKNPNRIYAGFTIFYKPAGELAVSKNEIEVNNIDEEISNIQSATEKTTNDISPLAE
jgi:nucleoid-associated protein YgaU